MLLAAAFFVLAAVPLVSNLLPDDPPEPPPPPAQPEPTPSSLPPVTSPPTAAPQLDDEKLPPLPQLKGPAPKPKGYESIEELAADLAAAGLKCEPSYLDQPDPTLKEFALCDIDSASRRLDLWLYENAYDRDGWLASMRGSGIEVIYGPNWIITVAGDPETAAHRARLVQLAIGGRRLAA